MVNFGLKTSKSKHSATQLTPDELVGFVFALTNDQKLLVNELKLRFANERSGKEDLYDDLFLVKFLRARQFDLTKTTTMLTKYFTWRVQVDVPKVLKMNLTSIRDTIKMYYPHCFYGTDKLGRPINIEHMGLSDTTKLVHVLPQDQLTNYFIQRYEYLTHVVLPACSIFANKNVEQILTIVDLKGLQVHQINSKFRSFLSAMSGLTQNYYPENLGKLLFINASPVFSAIYTVLSALVDKKTLSKISVISSKTESLERVAELVDRDQLPMFLGGTRPDENWYSTSFGPWTDESILSKLRARPHIQEDLYNYEFL